MSMLEKRTVAQGRTEMIKKRPVLLLLLVLIMTLHGCKLSELADRFSGDDYDSEYDYREMYLSNDTKDLTDKNLDAFNEASTIYRLYIENCGDDYEKVLAAHDYIVRNCRYNKEAIDNDTLTEDDFSPYGVFVKGVAVCEGYAKAFKMLMDIAGIDCIMVTGTVNDGVAHAWNMVKLENDWYHVDVTFDDPEPETKEIVYLYLNVPDSVIEKDHTWNKNMTPEAHSDKYDYVVMNDCELDTIVQVKEIIVDSSFRKESYVSFVWTGDEMITDQVWTKILGFTDIANLSYSCMGAAGRRMYMINLSY